MELQELFPDFDLSVSSFSHQLLVRLWTFSHVEGFIIIVCPLQHFFSSQCLLQILHIPWYRYIFITYLINRDLELFCDSVELALQFLCLYFVGESVLDPLDLPLPVFINRDNELTHEFLRVDLFELRGLGVLFGVPLSDKVTQISEIVINTR